MQWIRRNWSATHKHKPVAILSAARLHRDFYARAINALATELRATIACPILVVPTQPDDFSGEFQARAFDEILKNRKQLAACVIITPSIAHTGFRRKVMTAHGKNDLKIMTLDLAFHDIASETGEVNAFPFCVRADDTKGGQMAAQVLAEYWRKQPGGAKGAQDPSSMPVFVLKGDHAENRYQGFREEWGKQFGNSAREQVLKLATPRWAPDDVISPVSRVLKEHEHIAGFFACNDEMALATRSLVIAANRSIPIVGYDGNDWVKRLAEDPSDLIRDTIDTHIELQAQTLVNALDRWLDGSGDYRGGRVNPPESIPPSCRVIPP